MNWLEQEKKELETAKEAYMSEQCPAPDMSGDQAVLMVRVAAVLKNLFSRFSFSFSSTEPGLLCHSEATSLQDGRETLLL